MIGQGVVATVMRQTNIVWTILVAIGCLDVSLRQLLLTPREREDPNLIRTWHEIPTWHEITALKTKLPHLARNYFTWQEKTKKLQHLLRKLKKSQYLARNYNNCYEN